MRTTRFSSSLLEKVDDEAGQLLGAFLHEQVACVGEELEPLRARNVAPKTLCPLWAEVRIGRRPDDQRRPVEASQPGHRLESRGVVGWIDLTGQEPARLAAT